MDSERKPANYWSDNFGEGLTHAVSGILLLLVHIVTLKISNKCEDEQEEDEEQDSCRIF